MVVITCHFNITGCGLLQSWYCVYIWYSFYWIGIAANFVCIFYTNGTATFV